MKRWIRLVNQKDWQPSSSSNICIKHFEEKYYKKNKNSKRYRLAMKMKPFATIFDPKNINNKNSEINNVTSPICIPRRTTEETFISRRLI